MKQLSLWPDKCRQAVVDAAMTEFYEIYPQHSAQQYNDALHACRQDVGLAPVVPAVKTQRIQPDPD